MTVGKVKNFNFSSAGKTQGYTKDFTATSSGKAKGYADGGSPKPQATSRPLPDMGKRPPPVPTQRPGMQRPLPDMGNRPPPVPPQRPGMQRPLPMPPQRPGMPLAPGMSQAEKMQDYQRFVQNQQMNGAPVLPMAQWDKMRAPMGQPENVPPPGMGARDPRDFGPGNIPRPPGMDGMQPQQLQQMQQAMQQMQAQQGMPGQAPPMNPGLAGLGQQAMQQAQFSGNPVAGGGMGGQQNQANQLQQMFNQQSQAAMGQQAMPGGMGGPQPQINQRAGGGMPPPGMAKPMGYAKGGKVMGKVAAAPQGMIKNRGTLGVVGNKNPGETKMHTAPNLPSEKTMMKKGGKVMMGGGMAKSNKNC